MRLKPAVVLVLVISACAGAGLPAQPRRSGLGLVFVDPFGLSAKAWLGGGRAVSGAVGWSGEKEHYLNLQADFLFFSYRLNSGADLDLDAYAGVGGKVIFRDYDAVWFRVPLGLDLRLKNVPLNFFFEIVPALDFQEVRISGAVGFRYLLGS